MEIGSLQVSSSQDEVSGVDPDSTRRVSLEEETQSGDGHVGTEAETGVDVPASHEQPGAVNRGGWSPGAFGRSTAPPTPRFQTSWCHNWETANSCHLKAPVFWCSVMEKTRNSPETPTTPQKCLRCGLTALCMGGAVPRSMQSRGEMSSLVTQGGGNLRAARASVGRTPPGFSSWGTQQHPPDTG